MIPVGPFLANLMLVSTGPIRSTSSSWQSLTKWSSGLTRRTFSFVEALTLTMTPTAFSLTRWQKSCTTSKPTSASSSAVRTSLSASSTVASSSSASPWKRCFALRNPLVSVSNIGRGTYHDAALRAGRVGRYVAAGAARFVPPGLPALARLLALPARQIEVVAEVLAGERPQLLFGGRADLGRLVRETLEQPLDPVVVLVLLPPQLPAPRPSARGPAW